jgi:DNA (cytosine-5)-methyltransferase 1
VARSFISDLAALCESDARRQHWLRLLRQFNEAIGDTSYPGENSDLARLTHSIQNPEIEQFGPSMSRCDYRARQLAGSLRRSHPDTALRRRGTDLRHQFTFIDLFAGIGGFHLALASQGGHCVFSSEADRAARQTYALNFGIVPFGDIREFTRGKTGKVNSARITKLIPYADVIAAGFPCQPFSIAGVSSRIHHGIKHGLECTSEGTLFEDIVAITRAIKPKVLLLENVKNLATHDEGNTLRVIKKEIIEAGYVIFPEDRQADKQWAVIDSRSVVAQRRRRVYMVCIRKDLVKKYGDFVFPRFRLPRKPFTLMKILEKDKTLSNREKFANYSISERLWKSHQKRDLKHERLKNGFRVNLMTNLKSAAPTLVSRYYKDGKDCLIPNTSDPTRPPRMLTEKECALLQTFPSNFWIHPVRSSAYRQFGNSITVEIARRIAQEISEYLRKSERD